MPKETTTSTGWIHRTADFLDVWFSPITSICSAASLGLMSLFSVQWAQLLLLVAGVIFLIMSLVHAKRSEKRYKELENKWKTLKEETKRLKTQCTTDETAIHQLLRDYLYQVSYELGLWETDTRVTLYGRKNDNQGGYFIPLARCSNNPELAERGRPQYRERYGYLWDIWENSSTQRTFDDEEARQQLAALAEEHNDTNFIKEDASNLKMSPRSVIGVRLDGEYADKYGVILFESNNKERLDLQMLDTLINSSQKKAMTLMMRATWSIFDLLNIHEINEDK